MNDQFRVRLPTFSVSLLRGLFFHLWYSLAQVHRAFDVSGGELATLIATDIGNAYLEAYTSEKVYVIAGPEFGDLEGHIFVIRKALYGLKTIALSAGMSASLRFYGTWVSPQVLLSQISG